ncbi:PXA domain-domain-containing protein [Aspergillus taichungensis]|uniref:PXA domain-domain-containing protein n=1 Tax=Aspergillus taichungensis TaxID=482145 RepID=A0A2J5I3H5_9EURO|nr:PXA domain-domain-containing protein [Aspergillus taichungensis]
MSTDLPRPGLRPLTHLKAGPTTSSSRSTARPAASTLQSSSSQTSQRPQHRRNLSRDEQINPLGDKATAALIRRVLCPQSTSYGGASTPPPLEELLPPLSSSNDVDRQLYALVAIIVKEFVFSWYSKITADQAFAAEVIQVMAHCTRALEQRLRAIDVAQLLLDEIPDLIETHITSYRLARAQSTMSGFSPSVRQIYHTLNPHPSLSPIPDPSDAETITRQRENEAVYRQLLAQGMLAILLPTEDLENACLRTLVGDILADLILGNEVSGRMTQGWFLWGSVTKIIDVVRQRDNREDDTATTGKGQLQKFGLLSPREEFVRARSPPKTQLRIPDWIWNLLQLGYLAFVTLRFIVVGLFRVALTGPVTSPSTSTASTSQTNKNPTPYNNPEGKRPVLCYRASSMLSQLVNLPRRMPWLSGMLALFQYLIVAGPGRLGDTDSVLDRFLHETIQDYILTPTLLPNLLLASRAALFPSNTHPTAAAATAKGVSVGPQPAPHPPSLPVSVAPRSDPTGASTASSSVATASAPAPPASPSPPTDNRLSATEIATIKRSCAARILSLVPRPVARRFLGLSTSPPPPGSSGAVPGGRQESSAASKEAQRPPPPERAPSPPSPPELAPTSQDDEEARLLAAIETDILDLFADDYCNRHLVYAIIETVLSRLLPELSEYSVTELMEHRGVPLTATSRS